MNRLLLISVIVQLGHHHCCFCLRTPQSASSSSSSSLEAFLAQTSALSCLQKVHMGGEECNPETQNPVNLANNLFNSGLWIKPTIVVTNFGFLIAKNKNKNKNQESYPSIAATFKVCYCLSQTSADPQACFKQKFLGSVPKFCLQISAIMNGCMRQN